MIQKAGYRTLDVVSTHIFSYTNRKILEDYILSGDFPSYSVLLYIG